MKRAMQLKIEIERESDGRWVAEVLDLPGTMVYGVTRAQALSKVQALARELLSKVVDGRRLKFMRRASFHL